MLKTTLSLILSILLLTSARAQTSAIASQTVQIILNPILDIDFASTGIASGPSVNLPFSTAEQYKNGITSPGQQIRIRSNKAFKLSVQTNAASFSYSGTEAGGPSMPVTSTLYFSVTNNTTGGQVARDFDHTYSSLSSSDHDLLLNGGQGDNQSITVAYQARPGYKYPAGQYSVGVVYTATQP